MRGIRHRRGFTLVEVLSAGMVLAMSAAMIGSGVAGAMAGLHESRDSHRAAELLDETLTRIDLIGPDRILLEGPTEGRFPEPDQRFSWTAEIKSLDIGYLYSVTVRITWLGARGPDQVVARTLLNDAPQSHNELLTWQGL